MGYREHGARAPREIKHKKIFMFASTTFTIKTMANNPEEEFELVLGNRHLLSLFFVVVVFFAGFFTVGYTVGYGQGEESRPAPTLARVDPSTEPLNEIRMPDTLLKDAPKSPKPTVAKAKPPAAKPEAKPAATPVAAKPKPTKTAEVKPKPKPKPPVRSKPAAPKPAVAKAGDYQLQVVAVRVKKDAEMLAGKLKTQGYPASVQVAGDWNRVIVGPFSSAEAAQDYKTRLGKDGFDTMLRKL